MERIEIKQHIYDLSTYLLEGKLEDVAKIFNFKTYWKEVVKIQNPQNNLNIDIFHRFEIYFDIDYEGGGTFEIHGFRWETNEELQNRIVTANKASIAAKAAATKWKNKREAKEKELYIQLKAKYESKETTS